MKNRKTIISLILLAILSVIFGCDANNVNISEFKEIDYELAVDTLEEYSDRFEEGHYAHINDGSSNELPFGSRNAFFTYLHVYYPRISADELFGQFLAEGYVDEDEINIRVIEEVHGIFEEQYILFEEFCADNPDCIQTEMQDDRGYIIFDIEDPEIIVALSGESEVSEGTRYYGVRYHCDRCYIEATYMSDNNDDFRDFVNLLDEFGLPHM